MTAIPLTSHQPRNVTLIPDADASIPLKLENNQNVLREVGVTILSNPQSQPVQTSMNLGDLTLKAIRSPISLSKYLAARFSAYQGIGKEGETRKINENKRAKLQALGGEEIKFGLEGRAVHEGMFFRAEPAAINAKTVLLCTGSFESYENYAIPMVEAFKSMGHNVMVFNYEGFGRSEGNRSEKGVYRSVEAAYQYLRQEKHCENHSIVAWGYSLGSGAVSDLASKQNLDIVIDRGFSSMSDVAYQEAPQGFKTIAKVIFKAGAHFDNLSKLKKAQGNVFIAQGSRDTDAVSGKFGQRLHEAVAKGKHAIFREVDSGHHHFSDVWFSQGEDRAAVEQFLSR